LYFQLRSNHSVLGWRQVISRTRNTRFNFSCFRFHLSMKEHDIKYFCKLWQESNTFSCRRLHCRSPGPPFSVTLQAAWPWHNSIEFQVLNVIFTLDNLLLVKCKLFVFSTEGGVCPAIGDSRFHHYATTGSHARKLKT